jgi:hypothetical protein
MKTFIIIMVTAALTAVVTWMATSFAYGVQTGVERLWFVSAVKAPGRMALGEIQADMHAGRFEVAQAKIDAFMETWERFSSGPDSFRGPGIGDIMGTLSKFDTNNGNTTNKPIVK